MIIVSWRARIGVCVVLGRNFWVVNVNSMHARIRVVLLCFLGDSSVPVIPLIPF